MALINCSECEKQISDKAVSCPHCGAPMGKNTELDASRHGSNSATDDEDTFTGRFFTYIRILLKCGVLFLVVFLCCSFLFFR